MGVSFLVQDFGSKILWAFSFLVQGVFLVLSFCVPDFWVLGSLGHRLLGPGSFDLSLLDYRFSTALGFSGQRFSGSY